MAHYAAILHIVDTKKRTELHSKHVEFLNSMQEQGKIYAKGPFVDGTGGLVIYVADSLEEAQAMVEKDPYVSEKALSVELHEWQIK
ncbi:YciI family protein [Paenibacillus sp. TY11]|uniref:YciI family protein n=1 Tax=Paenibacillus sp. TY11 TaxID=3448633 RepID=UPI004039BFE0